MFFVIYLATAVLVSKSSDFIDCFTSMEPTYCKNNIVLCLKIFSIHLKNNNGPLTLTP